jgi:hypothetical protein
VIGNSLEDALEEFWVEVMFQGSENVFCSAVTFDLVVVRVRGWELSHLGDVDADCNMML